MAAATTTTSGGSSSWMRMIRRVGGALKTSLAVVGLATVGGIYMEYKNLRPALLHPKDDNKDDDDGDHTSSQKTARKKNVLIIPFDRLKLVEQKKQQWGSAFREGVFDQENGNIRPITMEVRELVDIIQQAATDPNIVALYGTFGHGSTLDQTGWANLEEIRTALRIFRESHRRHHEPNLGYQNLVIPRIDSKPLYAYADTFASFANPANPDYYLASAFTHVHMQQQGELNLFGIVSTQMFLRDFLNKYGITMHVFKHGQYKNAANVFTESKLDKPHRENVTGIVQGINSSICDDIESTRSKSLLTTWLKQNVPGKINDTDLWSRLLNVGTFTAQTAWHAGLVDYLPRRDPLVELIASNEKNGEMKEQLKESWNNHETDFDRFTADKGIHLQDYAKRIRKKKKAMERLDRWHQFGESRPWVKQILGMLTTSQTVDAPSNGEKIALLYAGAEQGIGDKTARKLVKSIRSIQQDKTFKAVVLRVTSPGGSIMACETILQELKGLKVPVVVSMGNVAASGGYYISSSADRIFASTKTVTGSIGVFGVRPDITGFAQRYGVTFDHVASGDLSAWMNIGIPMNPKMKKTLSECIDRYYGTFKDLVAAGRNLPLSAVEDVAQGRVWTGDQAKGNGLVDEVGGLSRAIAYAQRVYTSKGCDTEVVVWPKRKSFFEDLIEAYQEEGASVWSIMARYAGIAQPSESISTFDVAQLAHRMLLLACSNPHNLANLTANWSGIMLTMDENTAIRCLVANSSVGGDLNRLNATTPIVLPSFFFDD